MKMRNRNEYKADAAERDEGSGSMMRRMRTARTLLVLFMLLALPSKTFAQWGFDVSSVEAYINDHKKQRSLLLARSTLEYSNKLLHSYSKDETKAYKELNVDLEKRISLADTLLIGINRRAIENIAKEGEYLYKSVSDLVLYATGAAACSTADLLVVLESINTSLDNIEKHLNKSYFDSWRYIQVRIGYWKEKVYRTKSKQQILEDAFGRWRVAGKLGY